MQILGIDVGGTGIKAAIVDTATGTLLSERSRTATPKPATPTAIGKTLKSVLDQHRWSSGPIGMGFPAAIQKGVARTAANIDASFIGFPVATYFSEQTGCAVQVANDADVAGLAEMRFGAGKGRDGVVLIVTIGTGLGTAVFVDGHLLPNTELGHLFLDNGMEAERYASESVRIVQKLKWKEWGPRLNHYLTTMESLLWPDLVVLGGGVSKELRKFSPLITTKAPVVAASFLNQAGIVGAALFAEQELRATL
ncbi:polyphosphate--glucose phosphotransferase [Propionivibrio sp.]|uniref:polyphosphate--glucose phosphotransferase n=1 Tax=Propionivibrio sp. TaxID=2212460 RepID=UPI0025CCAEA8|nr:ROK family protein [Propionivibrio sp.]MBK7356021.1 ROK family protein [Propionivibrio sp.]